MHPTYIESILSILASSIALIAASTKMSLNDFFHNSPHFIKPTPIIATSLIIYYLVLRFLLFYFPDFINIPLKNHLQPDIMQFFFWCHLRQRLLDMTVEHRVYSFS